MKYTIIAVTLFTLAWAAPTVRPATAPIAPGDKFSRGHANAEARGSDAAQQLHALQQRQWGIPFSEEEYATFISGVGFDSPISPSFAPPNDQQQQQSDEAADVDVVGDQTQGGDGDSEVDQPVISDEGIESPESPGSSEAPGSATGQLQADVPRF